MSDAFNQALNADRQISSAGRSAGNAKRGAEFCHRTARTLRCRQLYSAAYVHDRKPKPPPSSFVHLAQWNQSGILPVHGAER
jgi:hypothetical protein